MIIIFNNLKQNEINQSKLNSFQGSTSISSDEYFGNGKTNKSNYSNSAQMPDMSVIKQDLKDGVTKVAGRLSSMASNVMTSLQVCKKKLSLFFILEKKKKF